MNNSSASTLTKKKIYEKFNITQNDVNVIAPYLWNRRHHQTEPSVIDSLPSENQLNILLKDVNLLLSNTIDLPNLLHETAMILKILTNSINCSLYLVDSNNDELYFYVTNNQRMDNNRISFEIQSGKTISTYVARNKEHILVNDIIDDDRFSDGIGWKGLSVTNCICVPIITLENECFAVIELYRDNGEEYKLTDLQTVIAQTTWVGAAIDQNQKRILLQKQYELNNYLLQLTENYIVKKLPLENVISQIVYIAKKTLKAEYGKFFYGFNENNSTNLLVDVFYETNTNNENNNNNNNNNSNNANSEEIADNKYKIMQKKKLKTHLNTDKSLVKLCIKSGELVNVHDICKDLRYDGEIDGNIGKPIKSILCIPITGKFGCIGVLELINKISNGKFTKCDEKLSLQFTTFSSILLHYQKMDENLFKSEKWNDLFHNMLGYHIINIQENIQENEIQIPEDITDFQWYIYPDFIDNSVQLIYYMIVDCCGSTIWEQKELYKFIITVRMCYKNIPYHNFEHACNVTHCIYCMLKLYSDKFCLNEKIALLFGALCHDIDHSGFTCNFLDMSDSPLVALYDAAILENHHSWFGKFIIRETNIFSKFSIDDYKFILKQFHENIIATNLKNHIKIRITLQKTFMNSEFNWNDEQHKFLARNIMITASDLSGQTKSFKIAKRLITNLYKEFSIENDMKMKYQSSGNDLSMNSDRNKKEYHIADEQIKFLDLFCLPCYELLSMLLPKTEILYLNCQTIQDIWKQKIKYSGHTLWNPDDSVCSNTETDENIECNNLINIDRKNK